MDSCICGIFFHSPLLGTLKMCIRDRRQPPLLLLWTAVRLPKMDYTLTTKSMSNLISPPMPVRSLPGLSSRHALHPGKRLRKFIHPGKCCNPLPIPIHGLSLIHISCDVTLCNIQEWSGAATDDSAISVEIRFDGAPEVSTSPTV